MTGCAAPAVVARVDGLTVEFHMPSGFGDFHEYHWAFGDGQDAWAGSRVTHTYAAPGVYEVEVVERCPFWAPVCVYRRRVVETVDTR